jgi:hypothetical protein
MSRGGATGSNNGTTANVRRLCFQVFAENGGLAPAPAGVKK